MSDKTNNDPTNWEEIKRYMNLTDEERRAEDRAKYRYLPADELMLSAGYEHDFLGMYKHRPGPQQWPIYTVSFFSQSGTCVLQEAKRMGSGHAAIAAEVVATDEQLQQFLERHQFPPIHPAG